MVNIPSGNNSADFSFVTSKIPDRELRLLDSAIFNVIIGNADAHGKNFSLLYHRGGGPLAPLYDLMCTVA